MFKEFNAHPKGIKSDESVVRAIVRVINKDYMECRRKLNRVKQELGYSSYKDTKFLYECLKDYSRLIFKPVK